MSQKLIEFLVHFSDCYYNVIAFFFCRNMYYLPNFYFAEIISINEMIGPDPDTPPGFPGWSCLVEFQCKIPTECTKGPHLKEM